MWCNSVWRLNMVTRVHLSAPYEPTPLIVAPTNAGSGPAKIFTLRSRNRGMASEATRCCHMYRLESEANVSAKQQHVKGAVWDRNQTRGLPSEHVCKLGGRGNSHALRCRQRFIISAARHGHVEMLQLYFYSAIETSTARDL